MFQKAPHSFSFANDQPPEPQGDLLDAILNFVPFGTIGKKVATGRGGEVGLGDIGLEAALTFLPFGKIAKGVAGIGKGAAKGMTKGASKAAKPNLRFPKSEQENLTNFVDYRMRRAEPGASELNTMIPKAWATGDKIGIDARGAAPARLQTDVADYLDAYNAQPTTPLGTAPPLGMPTAPPSVKGNAPMLQGLGRGLSKVSTISPKSTLKTAREQNRLIDLAQDTPALRGSAAKKFQNVEGEISRLTDEVDKNLGGLKTTVPASKFTQQISTIGDSLPDPLDRKGFIRVYNRAVQKVFGQGAPENLTPLQINQIRREINKEAGAAFRRQKIGTPPTAADNAIIMLRDELGDMIERMTPTDLRGVVKGLNKKQSILIDAIPEFKKGAEQGFPLPFSGGAQLPGSQLPFGAIQGATDVAGRGLSALGVSSLPAQITRNALGQVGRRGVANMFGRNSEQPNTLEGALASQDFGGMEDPMSGFGQMEQMQPQADPYPRENLLADMQRDPENADKYLAYYQSIQQVMSDPSQPKLTSASAGNITDIQTSLSQIDALEQSLRGSYEGGPFIGAARGMNPFDSAFKTQQAIIDTTRQMVGKALEGGVLRKEDEEKYKKIIPTMDDPLDVALSKLSMLKERIGQRLQQFTSLVAPGTAPDTLEDAVLAGSY